VRSSPSALCIFQIHPMRVSIAGNGILTTTTKLLNQRSFRFLGSHVSTCRPARTGVRPAFPLGH
jgi:hypothetical protein